MIYHLLIVHLVLVQLLKNQQKYYIYILKVVRCALTEARSTVRGIGIVRLMGRTAGSIAGNIKII